MKIKCIKKFKVGDTRVELEVVENNGKRVGFCVTLSDNENQVSAWFRVFLDPEICFNGFLRMVDIDSEF